MNETIKKAEQFFLFRVLPFLKSEVVDQIERDERLRTAWVLDIAKHINEGRGGYYELASHYSRTTRALLLGY
jgi:hypothetical protein